MSNLDSRRDAIKRREIPVGRKRVRRCDLPGNTRYGVETTTGAIFYKCRGRWRPVKCVRAPSAQYFQFSYYNHETKRRESIRQHVFVCRAFRGPPPSPRAHASHLNDDKADNRPTNLRWKTPRQNFYDGIANGKILRLGLDTARLMQKEYAPTRGRLRALAKQFGIHTKSVAAILSGKSYPELGPHPLYRGR